LEYCFAGLVMVKWLVGLGLILYAALWFGGEDRGQMRAGLRDAPAEEAVIEQVIVAAPAPAPEPEQPVTLASATELVPMLPRQPVKVMPPPEPVLGIAAMTATAADQPLLPEDTLTVGTAADSTLRWVAVERANVRAAANKTATVTARIDQGEAVAVLWTEPSGWARIRIEGDGVDGFIHESLLTDLNPQFQ
jgi:uncharacterized protein YgiM (DUF1202 family)